MLIRIPASASLGDVATFMQTISKPDDLRVNIELPEIGGSVHPLLVCLVACICDVEGSGSVPNVVGSIDAASELARMQLPEALGLVSAEPHFDPTGKLIPVRIISDGGQLNDFVTDFVPLLHAPIESANAVKYVLHELIRNVLEHSGSKSGAFASAMVADDGRIMIAVADAGIGITKTIRRSHAAADDMEAICLALTPGVSGATAVYGGNEQNGGAGLFFMKALATLAKQEMVVISGSKLMYLEPQELDEPVLYASPEDDPITWTALDNPFRGTAVGVNLKLEDSVAFAQLMDAIRLIYRSNVKDKKRAARKARFS